MAGTGECNFFDGGNFALLLMMLNPSLPELLQFVRKSHDFLADVSGIRDYQFSGNCPRNKPNFFRNFMLFPTVITRVPENV